MQLLRLTVENFRCYAAPFSIEFDRLTAIVGQNDVGKSTLMDALAIFFGEAKLDRDDACKNGDPTAVRIACEFSDLPDEIVVDTDFPTNLAREYMLNANGNLEVRKTFNGGLVTPKETAVELVAMHPSAEGYNDLLTLKRAELKARAEELGVNLEGVPANKNAPIREAIWEHCADLNPEPALIPIETEGGKQIYSALAPYLPIFALFKSDRASTDQDSEAQDPLKAAISEAIKAVEAKLREVKEHVESEVRKIADATKEKLSEMDPSIAETLHPVITTKKWDSLFQTSITGDEGVPLNKRGSGIKRLVLLNFFRAKAEKEAATQSSASVIYAIEEPETSQHPRNQRLLLSALRDLSSGEGKQVIVTTHTPMLARCLPHESLRFLERGEGNARSIAIGGDDTNARIAKSLGVLPDHDVRLFIGVEGPNDIAFLKGVSRVLLGAGENVPDLDRLELDGEIVFIPLGGSNLAAWVSRLKALNRPEIHIFDRDEAPPTPPKYAEHIAAINAREGCFAIATEKRETENYLHPDAIREAYQSENIVVDLPDQFSDFDDVPAITAEAVHTATGQAGWMALTPEKRGKKISSAKRALNLRAVEHMTADRLTLCDPNQEIRGWLNRIAEMMGQ